MKTLLLIWLFFGIDILWGEPWGKDADLVGFSYRKKEEDFCNPSFFSKFSQGLIQFHQEVISPADGPRSHFIPSSSQYTLDAMHRYGFFKGFILGCDRLMRENDDPWIYSITKDENGKVMKWDPVK